MSVNILLVDLSSIGHAMFHVCANEPDPNAASIKTVERVRALASGQPHVAICLDSPPYFRTGIDPQYKAKRDKDNNAVVSHQLAVAADTLRADGFPVWAVKGYEADDIIATTVRLVDGVNGGVEVPSVTIASADKDLLQLVSDRVSIKSLKDGSLIGPDETKAKFGVWPHQMIDYLSLVGDTSDNIAGCKGIGAKRAAELLELYGNIDDLFTALTTHGTAFTPAMATNLREFQPRLATVRELITLRTDAPIPFDEVFRERVPADVAVFGDNMENESRSPDGDGLGTTGPNMAVDSPMAQLPILSDAAKSSGDTTAAQAERNSPKAGAGSEPADSHQTAPPAASAPPGATNSAPPAAQPAPAPARVLEPEVLPPPAADFTMQLEPRSIGQAKALAADLFASRLFSAYGNAPAVLSTILAGRELGLQASASLRGIHVVDGKHMLAADLIRALIIRSGQAKYFRCTARTADIATFVTERKDDNVPMTLSYTMDEARLAGLVKKGSGWERSPADMLIARASSKLARLVFPEIVFGLYAPEEID